MSLVQLLIDATALGAMLALVAMGIALVFGVMRLVNFAYGELITIGAYTLVLTKGWPILLRVLAAFVVVIASSLLMELVFRPLRRATAATMLVATFAVSFLLQNMFLLVFGPQGETIEFLAVGVERGAAERSAPGVGVGAICSFHQLGPLGERLAVALLARRPLRYIRARHRLTTVTAPAL